MTLGNVYITENKRSEVDARQGLLEHEARHSDQSAILGGDIFLYLYARSSIESWATEQLIHTENCAEAAMCRNIFETTAGLTDGGYIDVP